MLYDGKQILITANSFVCAAERCFEAKPIRPGQFQSLIVPTVVCSAFAIELYFKAIITFESNNAKGHDLSQLYLNCSTASQNAVVSQLCITRGEFDKKIQVMSNAFVEWRYIFEKETLNIDLQFLNDLTAASKSVAEKLSLSITK